MEEFTRRKCAGSDHLEPSFGCQKHRYSYFVGSELGALGLNSLILMVIESTLNALWYLVLGFLSKFMCIA